MQRLGIPKKKRIYAIAFSPDGRDLAAVCGDGTLRVWDTTTGQLRRTVAVPEAAVPTGLVYLAADHLLVVGMDLLAYDPVADELTTLMAGAGYLRQLALSPDGRFLGPMDLTSRTESGGFRLVPGMTVGLPVLIEAPDTTHGLAFSPDGRLLATGHILLAGTKMRSVGHGFGSFPVNAYDYVVYLREMPSGRIVKTIPGWQQGVRFLTFSPDGSVLVGTAGPRLRAWDLANDRELALHKRGTKHFQGLAFTADGRYLATVSNDETVRLWDARTWAEKTTFTWDVGRLLNIAFAPDGLRAAAGSDKGQIVVWDVEG
jgi:WD40 repeat protein